MGAKQSNPLYPSRALRADPSAGDSSVGEDNLSGVVFSNERAHSAESKGGFFNLEHYLRDHERRMSTPERPPGGYLQHDPEPVDENNPDPTQHEYAPSKPVRESRRSRLRRQLSFRSKPPPAPPPPRHFKRDFASRKHIHTQTWNSKEPEWMSITYKLIAPLFVLRVVLGLVGLRSLATLASYGAWLLVLLDLPLVLGRLFTFAAWVALPNDHLYVTSLRIHAWLAKDDGTSNSTGDRRLFLEFCFGGMKCQHPAMTDVTDPTSDPYFYAAESGRVVASFGAEELTWLRAAARGFYRKYVSRSEKNELWPHRPFVLRVDGMDFTDAETVFTTSKEGELNYRRFKRCIAEDVVRKSLDKLAPPRRLNGKSEPWAVPNRVEVRCRAFEHKQTPVAEQSSNNLGYLGRRKRSVQRPVVVVRVRELTVKTAKGCGGKDCEVSAFASRFALPLPDVGAQITFDVDSTRAMRQRQKGKNKALAGTWSIRGRDLVEVILQTCKGTSPVVEGPRGTDVIHGEYVDVPSKLQKRHGMVQARAALLFDARRELVLVLEAKVQTSGVYQEAPRDGILDVSLRLLYDPEAPGIPAQMASQSRKLDPLEQLSLQLAENKRYSALKPRPPDRFALFEIRRCTVTRVRFAILGLFQETKKPKYAFRGSKKKLRDADTILAKRERSLCEADMRRLRANETFYVPIMDLSDALRAPDPQRPKMTLNFVPSRAKETSAEYKAVSMKDAEKLVIAEGTRQVRDDGNFGYAVAARIFGYGGAAGKYAYRAIWMEYLSARAFRYRFQTMRENIRQRVMHGKTRTENVYAETDADVPRVLAPVYTDGDGWRCRGYFHKRTHCKLIGMGYWGYYYAALHVAPDGPVLFYVQQTPCVNKHGVPIDDWYVVGNGGTSATGPIKKLSLQPGTFDVELDEAYKDHKAAGLQEGRFHVSFGDLNEWLGRMRKPSIERAAMTGVRSHERAPSSPTSDPSLPGSMRRTSVVQMDKINIFKARDGADVKVTIRPVRTPPGRHNGWNIEMKSAKSPEDTRRLFRALIACRPRAVRRRVGGRGNEWFDEELSERRVSYESAVPELPAVAVSREPEASINSDLAGNDAVCSTCPSRPVDL